LCASNHHSFLTPKYGKQSKRKYLATRLAAKAAEESFDITVQDATASEAKIIKAAEDENDDKDDLNDGGKSSGSSGRPSHDSGGQSPPDDPPRGGLLNAQRQPATQLDRASFFS